MTKILCNYKECPMNEDGKCKRETITMKEIPTGIFSSTVACGWLLDEYDPQGAYDEDQKENEEVKIQHEKL